MHIVMLGKPGSGKGTVGKMLSESLNIVHISSGELFRDCINSEEEIGKEINSYISKGHLVPDNLTIKLVEKRLLKDDCKNGVILDGFPRTVNQAEELDKFLEGQSLKIDIAVQLDISDEDIIDRITKRFECPNCKEIYNLDYKKPKKDRICDKCGSRLIQRNDDNIEIINNRLKEYNSTSEKVVNYYKEKDLLYSVKIDKHSKITSKDIAEELKNKFQK